MPELGGGYQSEAGKGREPILGTLESLPAVVTGV